MTATSKRGRPPLTAGEQPRRISVSVPAAEYDALYAKARREEVSVPAIVRRSLTRLLDDPDDDAA